MNETKIRVLTIDDNEGIHEDFRKVLTGTSGSPELDKIEQELFGESVSAGSAAGIDCAVVSATQGHEGALVYQSNLTTNPFDIVFVDMRMPPGWDGLRTIKELWSINPEQFIVLCSAYSDYTYEQITAELGAKPNFLIVKKPFEPEEILQIVRSVTLKDGTEVRRRKQMALELGSAVGTTELSLVFQPIINLKTSRLKGFEALCRWTRDGAVVERPDIFIKAAEDYGQITQLGLWVAEEAISAAAKMKLTGASDSAPTVTFNVSVLQLTKEFPGQIAKLCRQYGVEPSQMGVELTESNIMAEVDKCNAIVSELRKIGFCVLIDDFGSGYSSLGSLFKLSFDTLKIDRDFTANIVEDSTARIVVKTIIGMAQSLGMTFIAEGVETIEQRDALAGFGCDYAQGYLFSHPVSLDDALAILEQDDLQDTPMAA